MEEGRKNWIKNINWKKEIKSWGVLVLIFAVLYFTGLITPIIGGLQSLVLATGIIKPNTENTRLPAQAFDYSGQFTDTVGKTVFLENYKGKTLFINLCATWCPPCRAEMPHISELYKKTKDQPDLEFLMIALDGDFEKSKKFIRDKGFTFPVLHAGYGLSSSLQSQAVPTTLVVGPSGKVLFYHEGMSNFNTPEFQEFLIGASEE